VGHASCRPLECIHRLAAGSDDTISRLLPAESKSSVSHRMKTVLGAALLLTVTSASALAQINAGTIHVDEPATITLEF
jgi:hypothetical protein